MVVSSPVHLAGLVPASILHSGAAVLTLSLGEQNHIQTIMFEFEKMHLFSISLQEIVVTENLNMYPATKKKKNNNKKKD